MMASIFERTLGMFRLAACMLALCCAPNVSFAAGEAEALFKKLGSLSPAEREKVLIEGAKKEGKVVWYTTDSPRQTQILTKAFMAKYPFIDAQFIRNKSRSILDRIITEHRASRYLFDVAKTSTETFNLYPADVFAVYSSPAKAAIPDDKKGEKWASLFTFVRALSYNTNMLKPEEVPKTWEELLHPRWKDKILFDPSSLPEVTILYAKWGREKTADYLDKLGSSGNLAIRRGRTVLTQLLGAGEAPLAVTVYPYNVEDMKRKGSPIEWTLLDLTPGLLQPNSISRNSPNPHAAALFYDFLLAEGQLLYAKMGRIPTLAVSDPSLTAAQAKAAEVTKDPRLALITVNADVGNVDDAMKLLDDKVLKKNFEK